MELDIFAILQKMAELFLLMGVGYAANKRGVLDAESNRKLTRMVISLTLPALVFSSVVGETAQHDMGEVLLVLLVSMTCYLFTALLGPVMTRLLGIGAEDAGLYRFMLMFGNVAFMGFPVVAAIFGEEAIFYASLSNIPFNLLVYSLGILLVSKREKGDRLDLRLLLNAPFITSLTSLALYLLGVSMPSVVLGATRTLGAVTTPVSMLIIGSTLAALKPQSVFTEWRLYPLALLRLVVLPATLWFVLLPVFPDTRLLGILVVIMAMPVATNATMLTVQYGGNQALASKGIFLTTLLSAVTIPLLAYLMMGRV